MTEIRWKNGGPLFLQPAPGSQFGLVATDQNCCCPPPPPDRCWCGSTCSYFIELVEPSEIAVRTLASNCSAPNTGRSVTKSSLLQAIVPVYSDSGDFVFPASFSQSSVSNNGEQLSLRADDAIYGFPTFLPPELYYYQLYPASRTASLAVFCAIDPETQQPKHYARIAIYAYANYLFESLLDYGQIGFWFRGYDGVFELPSQCVVSPARECVTSRQEFSRITTPLEITLSGDGTSSLGNLTLTLEGGAISPDQGPEAKNAVDAILDATNYTFRITSRPACNNIPADCGVPIEGRTVYFPTNSVAVYGYEFGTPKTDVYDFGAWEFAHDGVANGTAESPYVFNAKKFAENPAGFILEEHNLEVFCALDDTVTPPVSRWYVREFVYCTPEFGRQTTDQWISEILTYPEPDRETPCEGVSAGDPVPVGITEYERVDGYPIVDFGEPCDPPPPIGLQITDGCS